VSADIKLNKPAGQARRSHKALQSYSTNPHPPDTLCLADYIVDPPIDATYFIALRALTY